MHEEILVPEPASGGIEKRVTHTGYTTARQLRVIIQDYREQFEEFVSQHMQSDTYTLESHVYSCSSKEVDWHSVSSYKGFTALVPPVDSLDPIEWRSQMIGMFRNEYRTFFSTVLAYARREKIMEIDLSLHIQLSRDSVLRSS